MESMKSAKMEGKTGALGSAFIFFGILFIILFAFFTQVHPLVIYDGDDWGCLSDSRSALPKWGAWNPIKVLPEESFPIVGLIAAYFVMPFIQDYVISIVVTSAFIISGLIVCYVFLFSKVLERRFSLNRYEVYALTLLFFLLHFIVFRPINGVTPYLFGSGNLTCFFHYMIPGLVNFCVVEYFLAYGLPRTLSSSGKSIVSCAFLIFAVYLVIFSNVFHSIILTAFVSVYFLVHDGKRLFHIKQWKSILKEYSFSVGILAVWFVSLIFEVNGGNAERIGAPFFALPIRQTLLAFWNVFKFSNIIVAVIAILVLFAGGYCVRKCKRAGEDMTDLLKWIFVPVGSAVLTFVYLVLVSAKAAPGYIARGDVLISVYGFLLIAIVGMLAFILEKHPKSFLAAPIVLFVVSCEVMGQTYPDGTIGRVSPKICYQIDYDIINQVVTASKAGQKEMVLRVPKHNGDNWPHPMYMGNAVSRTLYRHGLINAPIKITIRPDAEMNKKYHIPVGK